MRKTVLSVIGILLGGAGALAQQGQPGYSFVTSNSKSSAPAVVVPTVATPVEPGAIGAVPAPMSPAGAVYGGYPQYPMGPATGMPPGAMGPGMGGPMGMPMGGPGAAMPPGMDPNAMYGPGYPDMGAPNFALDPPSSFGTERVWVSAHYLLGYLTRPQLGTPLVTTGSFTDIHPGALGQPSTAVIFGNDQYQFGTLNGIRVDAGVNLNDRLYLEGSVLYFGPQHTNALFASDAAGNPFIGRPVFNTLLGEERSYLTSAPGLVSGSTNIESRLQLFSIEAQARYQVNLTPYLNADVLLGYRRMQLEEELGITDNLTPIAGSITFLGNSITAPNTISDFDQFKTTNQFNGVNTGFRLRWQSGFNWLAFAGYGKVAFGATQQTVDIAGVSTAHLASGDQSANGGILALSSNIGSHERTIFGVIPEGGASFIILLTHGVRFHAGYSATYWNNVVRAGDQIDRRVNPALVPTDVNFNSGNPGGFPAFTFRSRALWLQTLNFGLEFYY